MKALVVEADWKPRPDYRLSKAEQETHLALNGNRVWRNPRMSLKDVPQPKPGKDEVLIRVKACGICGSDTHFYETDEDNYILYSGPTKLPCIIGHEFSGIVEEVGKEVSGLKAGDMVTAEGMMWCGRCTSCRGGFLNHCERHQMVGFSVPGAYAEYIALDAKYCWKIDKMVNCYGKDRIWEAAALVEPISVAYNGIFVAGGGFPPGAYVVVYGLGAIGLSAVALSKVAGAVKVIAFDLSDKRVSLAKEVGADFSFNSRTLGEEGSSPAAKVLEITDGRGADLQVEAAGFPRETLSEMEESMALLGKIVYLGRSTGKAPSYLDSLVSTKGTIYGARGHSGSTIYPRVISLLASGRMDMTRIITASYSLGDVMEAIRLSAKREDGKIMVVQGGEKG